jgi:hypothetical protein
MLLKMLSAVICVLLLCTAASAQNLPNSVTGLKLPDPQTVSFDDGLISLHADCKGPVKWLVSSTSPKLKYKINPGTPNDIDIGIPPYEGVITVVCIGIVNNALTDYASTDIIVKGPNQPGPTPSPNPGPTQADVKLPLKLIVVYDPAKTSVEAMHLLDDLRPKLDPSKIKMTVYNNNDPALTQGDFPLVLKNYPLPLLVLKDNTGAALVIGQLPADMPSLLKLIAPYTQATTTSP